jgi:phospholipid/cholesterol/gamma-HCH transport system substrate-binding protein
METKANYVAVGGFVLLSILGIVVAVLWLVGAQYSQEFAYYQTYFTGSVTGLGKGTTVRYNGIDVGRVDDLQFDPDDPKRVIATLQIKPDLKLHEDSVASIASEGLTGGTYVEIDGGSKTSPLLTLQPGQKYIIIRSRPSTFQQLINSAPQLVQKLNVIGDRLMDVLNDKNRRAISDILTNVQDTTAVLQRRSGDIDAIIANLSAGTQGLNDTIGQMHQLLGNAGVVVKDTDAAVHSMDKLVGDTDKFVNGDGLSQIPQLVAQTRNLVSSLNHLSDKLGRQPTELLFGDRRQGYTPK